MRWLGAGGSYRTVQRFFNTDIPWPQVSRQFFGQHLVQPDGEYLLVGDESIITNSGKATYGLDRFFSGLLNKVVPGLAIFTLSLVSVAEQQAYPLQVAQGVRAEAEKATANLVKQKQQAKKAPALPKKRRGRPKGSQNRDKPQVGLSPELQRIQNMVRNQRVLLQNVVTVHSLALDGHFGHNAALPMTRQCSLHLRSKLRYDAALHFLYDGPQKSKGPRKRYGAKIDYRQIPPEYLVEQHTENGVETRIYQAQRLHTEFAQPLNLVIITKPSLKTGAVAHVNLFSSDLELSYEKIIAWYSLRFQTCTERSRSIEFNFRAAQPFWGLEDWMNVEEVPLTNALNLSLFMVNLSQVLLHEFRQTHPNSGLLDLKAYFRAAKYFEEMIKMLPQKPEPILLAQIFDQITAWGCIHAVNVHVSSP